ncbi:hypothetical protein ACRRTK_007227 [Alexandromys fortis]
MPAPSRTPSPAGGRQRALMHRAGAGLRWLPPRRRTRRSRFLELASARKAGEPRCVGPGRGLGRRGRAGDYRGCLQGCLQGPDLWKPWGRSAGAPDFPESRRHLSQA